MHAADTATEFDKFALFKLFCVIRKSVVFIDDYLSNIRAVGIASNF